MLQSVSDPLIECADTGSAHTAVKLEYRMVTVMSLRDPFHNLVTDCTGKRMSTSRQKSWKLQKVKNNNLSCTVEQSQAICQKKKNYEADVEDHES